MEKGLKYIKHLSVMYKVTSRFCTSCHRWKYHKIVEKIGHDGSITTTSQHVVCLKCKTVKEHHVFTKTRK